MTSEEFIKRILQESDKDYGICPPPIDAQQGLNIIIDHFLGSDWYVVMPLCTKQVNTEAIYEILRKYPKKKTLKDIIKKLLNDNK